MLLHQGYGYNVLPFYLQSKINDTNLFLNGKSLSEMMKSTLNLLNAKILT